MPGFMTVPSRCLYPEHLTNGGVSDRSGAMRAAFAQQRRGRKNAACGMLAWMRHLLTTDPGLEDVAADELQERLPGCETEIRPYGVPGHVRVTGADSSELPAMRTIHHVIEIRGEAEAETVDQVRIAMGKIDFPELESAASFRVTSKHDGEHQFGTQEIQRAAGGAVHTRYGTPVSLERFEVNVRADCYGGRLVAGIQRTADSLGNRIRRARPLRSALRPTVAAAMLRLAGAHRGGGRLADPMCGAGTIPIEAAALNPDLSVTASDWDEQTVQVARETIAAHELAIDVETLDARKLGAAFPGRFDWIVTDPPYGLRQAKRTSIARLYRGLLDSFGAALSEGGAIVLIVVKYRAFLAAVERSGLRIEHERRVDLGGIDPRIFVLRR